MRRSRGFTLVELLVVIGIIVVLIAILMPALISANKNARQIACASNMRQIGIACLAYVSENKGRLPIAGDWFEDSTNPNTATRPYQAIYLVTFGTADWEQGTLWPYIPGGAEVRKRLFNCPAEGTEGHQGFVYPGTSPPAAYANFDYTFSDQLMATYMDNDSIGLQMSRVVHAEHKMLLTEIFQPGFMAATIVEDMKSTLAHRHFGQSNVLWLDGHVQQIQPEVFDYTLNGMAAVHAYEHYYDVFSNE